MPGRISTALASAGRAPVTSTSSSPVTGGSAAGVARSVKSAGVAVPPASLTTSLASVSCAVRLVAVHATRAPMGTVTPPLRPSVNPAISFPSASTRRQDHDPVDSG